MFENTIYRHYKLMEAHKRGFGNLTVRQEKTLIDILEKRMLPNAALYADYVDVKKAESQERNFEDTWENALLRFAGVIQNVRDLVAMAAKYGNLTETRKHVHRKEDGSTEEADTTSFRKTAGKSVDLTTIAKSALKATSIQLRRFDSGTKADGTGQAYCQTSTGSGRPRNLGCRNSNLSWMWTRRTSRGNLYFRECPGHKPAYGSHLVGVSYRPDVEKVRLRLFRTV